MCNSYYCSTPNSSDKLIFPIKTIVNAHMLSNGQDGYKIWDTFLIFRMGKPAKLGTVNCDPVFFLNRMTYVS